MSSRKNSVMSIQATRVIDEESESESDCKSEIDKKASAKKDRPRKERMIKQEVHVRVEEKETITEENTKSGNFFCILLFLIFLVIVSLLVSSKISLVSAENHHSRTEQQKKNAATTSEVSLNPTSKVSASRSTTTTTTTTDKNNVSSNVGSETSSKNVATTTLPSNCIFPWSYPGVPGKFYGCANPDDSADDWCPTELDQTGTYPTHGDAFEFCTPLCDKCIFPWKFEGVEETFHGCANPTSDAEGNWCPTNLDEDGFYEQGSGKYLRCWDETCLEEKEDDQ